MPEIRIHHCDSGKLLLVEDGKIVPKGEKHTNSSDTVFERNDEGEHVSFKHKESGQLLSHGDDSKFIVEEAQMRGKVAFKGPSGNYLAFDGDGNITTKSDKSDTSTHFQTIGV